MEPIGALPAKQIGLAKYFGKASPLPRISCDSCVWHHTKFLVAAGVEGSGEEEDHLLLLIPSRLLVEIPTPGDGRGPTEGDLPWSGWMWPKSWPWGWREHPDTSRGAGSSPYPGQEGAEPTGNVPKSVSTFQEVFFGWGGFFWGDDQLGKHHGLG